VAVLSYVAGGTTIHSRILSGCAQLRERTNVQELLSPQDLNRYEKVTPEEFISNATSTGTISRYYGPEYYLVAANYYFDNTTKIYTICDALND
jgi:hypothetical protein